MLLLCDKNDTATAVPATAKVPTTKKKKVKEQRKKPLTQEEIALLKRVADAERTARHNLGTFTRSVREKGEDKKSTANRVPP